MDRWTDRWRDTQEQRPNKLGTPKESYFTEIYTSYTQEGAISLSCSSPLPSPSCPWAGSAGPNSYLVFNHELLELGELLKSELGN